ncbi:unnamed protein product [Prunus brigantina]
MYLSASILCSKRGLRDHHIKKHCASKGCDPSNTNPLFTPETLICISLSRIDLSTEKACRSPQAYMPLIICVGQHLAMTELKVILAMILSK